MSADTSTSPPRSVAWLGYGGLVPFVGLALAAVTGLAQPLPAAYALLAYGAVILSFVGALHWAFAMLLPSPSTDERDGMFIWSTVPALAGWLALMLPTGAGALVVAAGLVTHFVRDRRLARSHALPAWYLPLRLRLTVVASICLVAGGLA